MSFNPDTTKQAKVVFSNKTFPYIHPFLFFNNSFIEQATIQEHLSLTLDQERTFQYHVNKKKAMTVIGLLRKL